MVDGGTFAPGALDPTNSCLTCQPLVSSDGFSPFTGRVPPAGACPQNCDVCDVGSCTLGCFIGGTYLFPATSGPDAGQGPSCCAPTYSTTGYTVQWQSFSFGVGNRVQAIVAAPIAGSVGLAILSANYADNTVGVMLNHGDGTFAPTTLYPSISQPGTVGAGDLNGDGVPDLVVGNAGQLEVAVSYAVDSGFGTPVVVNAATQVVGVAPHFFPSGSAGAIFGYYGQVFRVLGELPDGGVGTLQTLSSTIPGVGVGTETQIADLNGDGLDDLAILTSYQGGAVAVLLNDGSGRLGGEADYLVPSAASGLAVGAFFGHHYASGKPVLDLAATTSLADGGFQIQLLENNSAGDFTPAGIPVPVPSGVEGLTAGDFNGDGLGDVAAMLLPGTTRQLFLGDGNGGLTPGPTFPSQTQYNLLGNMMVAGPFSATGGDDLVAVTGQSTLTLWDDACPSPSQACQGASCGSQCTIGGATYAARAPGPDAGLYPLCCAPQYNTANWTDAWQGFSSGVGNRVQAIVAAPIAGSVGLAILSANYADNTVGVMLNHGDGTFAPTTLYPSISQPGTVGAGDLNGDGVPDLVVGNAGQLEVAVSYAVDSGFGTPVVVNAATQVVGVAPHFFPSGSAGAIFGYYGQVFRVLGELPDGGVGTLQTLSSTIPGVGVGTETQIADLNGDGLDDLAILTSYQGGAVAVLLNDGSGRLGGEADYLVPSAASGLAVGAFFGHHYASGKPVLDLAATTSLADGGFQIQLLENNSAGDFTPAGIPVPVPSGVESLAAGDFDGDGYSDLAALLDSGMTIQLYFGDGAGDFVIGPSFPSQTQYNLLGNIMVGGPFAAGGLDDLIALTGPSTLTAWDDVCR